MASITITVAGTNGLNIARTFTTDDGNVPDIVMAYIEDESILSGVDANGDPVPRDSTWAVGKWMGDAISMAVRKAMDRKRRLAVDAAVQAVPAIVVTQG